MAAFQKQPLALQEARIIMHAMQAQSRRGKRWRRFRHKYGGLIALCLVVLCVLGFVAGVIGDNTPRARQTHYQQIGQDSALRQDGQKMLGRLENRGF